MVIHFVAHDWGLSNSKESFFRRKSNSLVILAYTKYRERKKQNACVIISNFFCLFLSRILFETESKRERDQY